MKKIRVLGVAAAAMLALCSCMFLFGCGPQGSKEVKLASTVEDTALVSPGTLTAGVDSKSAPFGGESNGAIVGVDVDVAAALATELGLELVVVDTNGADPAALLNEGKVDLVMSQASSAAEEGLALVGPYLENGPSVFGKTASGGEGVDPSALTGKKVAAFAGSVAASVASQFCGNENMVSLVSLSEAFDALQAGEVDYVAADLVAGGYIALSYADIGYAGSLQSPAGLYIGMGSNEVLSGAVNNALSTIKDNGILKVILSKWTGSQCAEHAIPQAAPEQPVQEAQPAAEPAPVEEVPAEPAPVEEVPAEEVPAEGV